MSFRLLGLLFAGVTATAMAADFKPTVELGVLRTDNLTLDPVTPEPATIWQLTPSFLITQESRRLSAKAAYRMEAYHYNERSETQVFHQFDGDLSVAVVPDRFFFNLGASRSQAAIDPESQVPISNLIITPNRVDLNQLYAGPSFKVPLGSSVRIAGAVRRTSFRYAEALATGGQRSYDYDTDEFSVENYRKGAGFTWAVRYNEQNARYKALSLPYDYRQAAVELGSWINQSSRVFVTAGKESPWDNPFDSSLADSFWEVGFARNVAENLSAEFAVGERTFGSSGRARLTYVFDRGRTEMSYSETPATNSADRYFRGGLLDPSEPVDYLFRAGSVERFISKRLQWDANFDLEHVGVAVVLFDETRDQRSQLDGTALPDELQSGVNLSLTWKFGSRLSLVLAGSKANRDFADRGRSDLYVDSFAVNYQLGTRTLLVVRLEEWEERSSATAALNYQANVLSARVARTFK